jgi:hypothetical protein
VDCGDLTRSPFTDINQGGNAGTPPTVSVSGASWYGVWGAAGSRNGGESATLP